MCAILNQRNGLHHTRNCQIKKASAHRFGITQQ